MCLCGYTCKSCLLIRELDINLIPLRSVTKLLLITKKDFNDYLCLTQLKWHKSFNMNRIDLGVYLFEE